MVTEYEGNIKCQQIYPVKNSNKTLGSLITVGIALSPNQARELSDLLRGLTEECNTNSVIDLTAFRGQNMVTVTRR